MRSPYNWLLVAFAITWMGLAVRGIARQIKNGTDPKWLIYTSGMLLLLGAGGFFGADMIAEGIIPLPGSLEWPAGYAKGVIQFPEGVYVVPLDPVGRVQLYDANWRFQRGWQIPALGGAMKVGISEDGLIDVFTARGHKYFTFDEQGDFVDSGPFSDSFDAIRDGTSMKVPTFILLWPFSSPFLCCALMVSGMVGLGLEKKWAITNIRTEPR